MATRVFPAEILTSWQRLKRRNGSRRPERLSVNGQHSVTLPHLWKIFESVRDDEELVLNSLNGD